MACTIKGVFNMVDIRFSSIRLRLVFWFLFVSIPPLVTVIVIIFFQRASAIRDSVSNRLSAIRDLKVKQINNWFDAMAGDIRVIASDDDIRVIGSVIGKGELNVEEKKILASADEHIHSIINNYVAYNEVFIVHPISGVIELSTDRGNIGKKVIDKPYFTEAKNNRKLYINDIHLSKDTNAHAMELSMPIINPESVDNSIAGILVTRINLNRTLYALLLNRTGMGMTGETLIVNSDLIALNKLRWIDNNSIDLRITAEAATLAAAGKSGVVASKDYRQVKVLAAYTHMPLMHWGFIAKQDLSEVYASIKLMFIYLMIILGISMVTVLIVAYIVSRSIASPIIAMSTVAEKIASGDLTKRNKINLRDELGVLAKSFNTVAESLMNRIGLQDNSAMFTRMMIDKKTIDAFYVGVLEKFIDLTNADFAAFFIISDTSNQLVPVSAIGMELEDLRKLKIGKLDSIFGSAIVKAEIIYMEEIPDDTKFYIKTIAGSVVPRELSVLPVIIDGETVAIISLGSILGFSRLDKILMKTVLPLITSSYSIITANEAIRSLADKLSGKNKDLVLRSDELRTQSNELQRQTEELYQQQAEVEDANRMKSVFLANMSHELRTPLNSILSIPQGMLTNKKSNLSETDKNYLMIIEKNGKVLLELINDILDLAKIEAGKIEILCENFSLNDFIVSCITNIQPLAAAKGLIITHSIEDDIPVIYSDSIKLRQVFNNLVGNSIKFTEKGTICVKAGIRDISAFIEVSDTGIGMNETELSQIFDKFKQLDDSITRKFEGSGLGLAISRKIMRLLGGDIIARSEYGKGSIFTILLPFKMNKKNNIEDSVNHKYEKILQGNQADHSVVRGTGISVGTILIVEDNPDTTEQIKNIITELEFEAVTTSNGKEALRKMDFIQFDGIILDLVMPEMGGFEFLDNLSLDNSKSSIPILIISAKDLTSNDIRKLMKSNVTQTVLKGNIDRKELKSKIITAFNINLESRDKNLNEENKVQLNVISDQSRRKPLSGVRPKIIIIEDNHDNIMSIKLQLADIKCDFIEAVNGMQGMAMLMKRQVDLVLLDIQMPGMSGYEVVSKIRANKDLSDIPVIAITAHAMKGDREKILSAGFDNYIAKPVNKTILVEMVSKYLY